MIILKKLCYYDEHKNAVGDLDLGWWRVGWHSHFACEFLDFRQHTCSIIGGLFMLRETYEDVRVAKPRFLGFEDILHKIRLAWSYGAAGFGTTSVISAVNLMKSLRCILGGYT